ncbi:MAG: hypothetical protein H6553_13595 [Chitinophagales bacterium]|nr:hypothetical protein [Chitinophagales bacterium]
MKKHILILLSIALLSTACKKENNPKLIFKFKFDSTQTRLNNFGQTATIPANHGTQSPIMHGMSAHYIELAPDSLTQIGKGDILYKASETSLGGENAIDFSKAIIKGNGEIFYSVPLKNVTAGTYKWLRVSLAYQNYDIQFRYRANLPVVGLVDEMLNAEVASFVGFNTYITSYNIKGETITVNGNRKQGYGAAKAYNIPYDINVPAFSWQALAGATTVPNPISLTSPIPAGSCVVTGRFLSNLTITGNETEDIVIVVSLSVNNSFEWYDVYGDNIFEPVDGMNNNAKLDSVVDMGIRGLIPYRE